VRDLLKYLPKGARIPEEQWRIHTTLLKAQNSGAGCFVDSTGTYSARAPQRRTIKVYAKLTANLDCAAGSIGSTATARRQRLNRTSKGYENDPAYPDEITVYETQGAFCGVEGEIIEVRNAGTDDEGNTIWEVVRGGAARHTGTLSAALSQGSSADVSISGRDGVSVEATDIFLPSGTSLDSGTFVEVGYNTDLDPPRWEVTGAPGDQCETCPDPCT
jgi:hypothetical protein